MPEETQTDTKMVTTSAVSNVPIPGEPLADILPPPISETPNVAEERSPALPPMVASDQPEDSPRPQDTMAEVKPPPTGGSPEERPRSTDSPQPLSSWERNWGISRELLARARGVIQFRKRAKLDKILKLAEGKNNEKKLISNDMVEKLLRVSDATADVYLRQLVNEGKLRKVGAGRALKYELK